MATSQLSSAFPTGPTKTRRSIRAVSSEPVGSPRFTTTARDTFEKIIETVFLALIATTFATLLAVPLSFFAARNLMEDITSPLTNVAMALIAAPLGVAAGVLAARGASAGGGYAHRQLGCSRWPVW